MKERQLLMLMMFDERKQLLESPSSLFQMPLVSLSFQHSPSSCFERFDGTNRSARIKSTATMSQGSKKAAVIKSLIAHYADSDDEMSPDDEESAGEEAKQTQDESPDGHTSGGSTQGSVRTMDTLKNPILTDLMIASSRSNSPLNLLGTSISSLASGSQKHEHQKQRMVDMDFPLDDEDRPTSPTSFHKTLEGLNPTEIVIPPEPPGRCSESVLAKMERLKEKKIMGMDMVQLIQRRKDFRNPSIYEKLIDHCSIDEFGTNFPPDVYDPHAWGPESYYESLSEAQKILMTKRETERKERTKVEFVTGTAKKTATDTSVVKGDEGIRKRSKWDIEKSTESSSASKSSCQPSKVSVISSVSGTKK